MGLFSRPELSAAIRRHLPALAAANHKGMRWKRFLFRQLCEQTGGSLCKTPDCGRCSDYSLCFAKGD
jgi:nitrogen fixation protein NifQ